MYFNNIVSIYHINPRRTAELRISSFHPQQPNNSISFFQSFARNVRNNVTNILERDSKISYSRKLVMSLLEHLDQATPMVSTSKVGVITCRVSPSRLLHPIFSVSWYMPKLESKSCHGRESPRNRNG